jgi:hypothetical protein
MTSLVIAARLLKYGAAASSHDTHATSLTFNLHHPTSIAFPEQFNTSTKPSLQLDVVSSFDVFVTNKHGTQGTLNRASKGVMENEFGTSKEDDVVKKILEDGAVQEQKVCCPSVLMARLTLLSRARPGRATETRPTLRVSTITGISSASVEPILGGTVAERPVCG